MILPDQSAPLEAQPLDPTFDQELLAVDESSSAVLAARAHIKRWQGKITNSKAYFKNDFEMMRDNMNFIAGYQWNDQKKMDDDRYIVNFLLRLIKHKVATLYAKDPKTDWNRRKRLDYLVWDGKLDSLMLAVETAQQTVMSGGILDPHTAMVLQDYMEGKQWEQLTEKVGAALQILYQYQLDTQQPEFKTQFKDLVDRTCVCGVGYVRVNLCRAGEQTDLTQSVTKSSENDRIKRAKGILDDLTNGEVESTSAQMETLKSLIAGLGIDVQSASPYNDNEYDTDLRESLVFDFPSSTSVIVDPRCKRLKGFVGARWVALEYKLPMSEVNALYGTKIRPGGDLKTYRSMNDNEELTEGNQEEAVASGDDKNPIVCLHEVFDLNTKTKFIICDGWKDYVVAPTIHRGINRSFWPVFALTFNSVETEAGCKATIYPPSDVQLGKSQQKEWNRSRNALRGQRMANRPKYMYADGQLDQKDAKRIATAADNEVFPVKLQQGQSLSDVFGPITPAPIDPNVYDTTNVKEDLLLATGSQEANLGPAQANVTATNSTIAEQSRSVVAGSNVDDLDDLLNAIAEYSGGVMLNEFSRETVVTIVGRGATWPQTPQTRNAFQREILLSNVSASTGRPNKALNINNFERIVPMLQAANANPYAIIEEAIKVYDANLDPEEFFPIPQPPGSDQNSLDGEEQSEDGDGQPSSQPGSAIASRGTGQTMPAGVQPMQVGSQTAVAA